MIVVQTTDEPIEFAGATRFSTDEHNNLCVWSGRKADMLLAVFNASRWENVTVELDEADDGDNAG